MKSRYPGWDGSIKMLKYDKVPAGLFWATYKRIEKEQNVKFDVDHEPETPVRFHNNVDVSDKDPKYKFQDACIGDMMMTVHYGGGLILNATGSGKTRLAGKFFKKMKGWALFVVDQLDLLEQAKQDIEAYIGEEVGYVGNSVFKPKRITVATVQTMAKHVKDPKYASWTAMLEVICVDEIHVQMNRSNFSVVENIQPKAVFGLTATLQLSKKPVRVRAWALAGPVVYEYPLARGMKLGVLAKGIVLRIIYPNPIPGEATRERAATGLPDTDYREEYSAGVLKNSERNAIVTRVVRYAVKHGKYVIVHVERLKHMKFLAKRLKKAKVAHELVAGTVDGEKMEVSTRRKVIRKFEAGKIRCIVTNKVFKKGVDIKRVDLELDAAALKSKDDALQKFGRGVRRHEEKSGLLYMDMADVDPMEAEVRKQNYKIREKNQEREKLNKYRRQENQERPEDDQLEMLRMIPLVKTHRLHRAAASRKRAYVKAGIKVYDFRWGKDGEVKAMFRFAERLLRSELQRGRRRGR